LILRERNPEKNSFSSVLSVTKIFLSQQNSNGKKEAVHFLLDKSLPFIFLKYDNYSGVYEDEHIPGKNISDISLSLRAERYCYFYQYDLFFL
jgi:hypothetical protein